MLQLPCCNDLIFLDFTERAKDRAIADARSLSTKHPKSRPLRFTTNCIPRMVDLYNRRFWMMVDSVAGIFAPHAPTT